MIKIYTKTGDRGTTSLFGGARVDKNSARIRAYGEVDELNSLIGVILGEDSFAWALVGNKQSLRSSSLRTAGLKQSLRSSSFDKLRTAGLKKRVKIKDKKLAATYEIANQLFRIQTELFVLGADLATPLEVKTTVPRITRSHAARLEREIDRWSRQLAPLRNFILPGGGKIVSKLHLARTVARRAERSVVDLASQEKINRQAQAYINRLSDWLFTLARYINKLEGDVEIVWKGRSQK